MLTPRRNRKTTGKVIRPMKNEQIHRFEACEMAAWGDFYRATPEEAASRGGIQVEKIDGALATIAACSDALALNRVLGVGLHEPATEKQIDTIVKKFKT